MQTCLGALCGGVLIGLSAVLLMVALGRIAGISGIASGLIVGVAGDRAWRAAFVLGLLAGPLLLFWLRGDSGAGAPQAGLSWMALAGLLVGIGWGIAGYCPGPALASLGAGVPALLVLVACMIAGWWLAARLLPPAGGTG